MNKPSDAEQALAWLIDNSHGVVGLKMDGSVMPWDEVLALYVPYWSAEGSDKELQRETGVPGVTYDIDNGDDPIGETGSDE